MGYNGLYKGKRFKHVVLFSYSYLIIVPPYFLQNTPPLPHCQNGGCSCSALSNSICLAGPVCGKGRFGQRAECSDKYNKGATRGPWLNWGNWEDLCDGSHMGCGDQSALLFVASSAQPMC